MKSLLSLAAAVAALILAPTAQATDVGVSISVSQPGVYGRIDIGRYPQPVLVQPQPIIIQRGPRVVEPVYLWVPPGHQKNWRKHCRHYNACGVPVYFVQEGWYHEHVGRDGPPRRDDRYDDRRDDRHDHGKRGHGKGHGRDRD